MSDKKEKFAFTENDIIVIRHFLAKAGNDSEWVLKSIKYTGDRLHHSTSYTAVADGHKYLMEFLRRYCREIAGIPYTYTREEDQERSEK